MMQITSSVSAWLASDRLRALSSTADQLDQVYDQTESTMDLPKKFEILHRIRELRRSADAIRGAILEWNPKYDFDAPVI